MRSIQKYFFLLFSFCYLIACQENEILSLKDYPTPVVSLSILNAETPTSTTIVATYQPEGKLVFDKNLGFKIFLEKPYIEDVVVDLEYTLENISSDSYDFNKQVKIPAGQVEYTVSMNDLSETFKSLEEASYRIGIKAVKLGVGNKTIAINASAEIKIVKEAFSSTVSLESETGNSVSFTRIYWDGTIKNEVGMSTKLFAKLSKILYENVTLSLSLNASDDRLKDYVTFSSPTVVIPAGSLVSPEIICNISDDFLLESDKDEIFTFEIKAEVTTENTHLDKSGLENVVEVTINKTSNIISITKVLNPDWVKMNRNNWKISAASIVSGDLNSLIDDSEYTYVNSYNTTPLWIRVDFENKEELKGAGFNISSRIWYPPTKVELSISEDGIIWKSLGTAKVPDPEGYSDFEYYLDFLTPISTRCIKYEILEASSSTKYLAEFYTFK